MCFRVVREESVRNEALEQNVEHFFVILNSSRFERKRMDCKNSTAAVTSNTLKRLKLGGTFNPTFP